MTLEGWVAVIVIVALLVIPDVILWVVLAPARWLKGRFFERPDRRKRK